MTTPRKPTNKPINKSKELEIDTLSKENKVLRSELDEIKQMILQLTIAKAEEKSTIKSESSIEGLEEYDDNYCIEIPSNKFIKIISLNPYMLNISTEGMGKGKSFTFIKYGQTKDIIYSEIVDIINNEEKRHKRGLFRILNEDVVKKHDLEDDYDKLLTKKTIDNIMSFDSKQVYDVFKNANKSQQKIIVSILINKIRDGEEIDLNKLNIVSRIYGENIQDIAKPITNED